MILYELLNTPQKTFIQNISDDVINACDNTGLFASVTMAQLCLETGYGKYLSGGNNYFGVKSTGKITPYWNGESTKADTTEVINGQTIRIKDGFRKYPDAVSSIKDRNYLLLTNKRYRNVALMQNPQLQIEEIKRAGYATDPDYVKKIMWIIGKFELLKLDK